MEVVDEICAITGLSALKVRRTIEATHGKTLLRNLFSDEWPGLYGQIQPEQYDDLSDEDTFDDEDTSDDADISDDADTSDDADNDASYGTQGGQEHQAIQRIICQIGQIKNYHIRTNYDIGAGLRPDVLWFKLDPEKHNGPALVVEIERGTSAALQKSLSSLKHANDRWPGAQLRIIVPQKRVSAVKDKLTGAFHEISENLIIASIEDCIGKTHYDIAKTLDLITKLKA